MVKIQNKKVVLCVLDGWGIGEDIDTNATSCANTPNFDFLIKNFPNSRLRTDGEFVGLLNGQMGNSEVGHMTIGAGRPIRMHLPKIDEAIQKNSLENEPAIQKFIGQLRLSGGIAHLAGLFSSGGVHAHQDHMIYLANLFASNDIKVCLHLFLDGRDVPPKSAIQDINRLELVIHKKVRIATVIGRFYAMDRDNRWERVKEAFDLLVSGFGTRYKTAVDAVQSRYKIGETDEFIKPSVIEGYTGFSKNADGLFFLNYRADRARQLLSALCDPDFEKFNRDKDFSLVSKCGLVEYSTEHNNFMECVFRQEIVKNTLGECLSRAHLSQFRLAETEKYPHVTFFFNAGIEDPNPGESRVMIPSPKVSTYDLAPKMSANAVTEKLIESIEKGSFDFILVNFANPDMVGHSGSLDAAIKACEEVDKCLGRIFSSVRCANGILLITSDHGNCEQMYDPINKSPHTSHTLNPVPFIVVGVDGLLKVSDGSLSDIAPTVLALHKINVPGDMSGISLL